MSAGVVMYGAPGVPGWPDMRPSEPFVPPVPSGDAGRILDFLGAPKKQAVVSVMRTADGFKVKVTVDGVLVSEAEVTGGSAALTVAL